MISDLHIANGLRVLCHEVPGSSLGVVTLLYGVGSRYEVPGELGYAHLFEHLIFDGSRSLGRGEYDHLCTMAGGENNAWTSIDLTGYWLALPSEQLELGLWLEADRMAGFGVSEESLRTQISVIRAEKHQVIDNVPYGDVGGIIRELLYPENHPYRHEPIGSLDDLAEATIDRMRDFFTRFYRPDNATLVVAGDMPHGRMEELVRYHFEEIHPPDPPLFRPDLPEVSLSSNVERHVRAEITPLPGTFLAWHAPALRDEDLKSLELLAMILADGDSSRLTLSMEYDLQVASETGAWVEEGQGSSIFHLYAIAAPPPSTPEELRSRLLAEVERIVRDGITPKELQKVRNRKQSSLLASLASISTRSERLAWYATIFDDPGLVWNEAKEYDSITPEQISAAAARYLLDSPSASVLYHTL